MSEETTTRQSLVLGEVAEGEPLECIARESLVMNSPTGRGNPHVENGLKLARSHIGTAVRTLVAVMVDDSAKDMARVKAAEVILDRGMGKAPQVNLNVNKDDDAPMDKKQISQIARAIVRETKRMALEEKTIEAQGRVIPAGDE